MSLIAFSDKLSKFLMVAAAAWAFGLTFLILADIIGRSAFDSPVQGTPEIVTASIVIIVYLQAGYAIRSRSMLKADFLVVKLPEPVSADFAGLRLSSRRRFFPDDYHRRLGRKCAFLGGK